MTNFEERFGNLSVEEAKKLNEAAKQTCEFETTACSAFAPVGKLTNTREISLCHSCDCMTFILMDDDGNRFCGKCKAEKPRPKHGRIK